MLRAIIIDDEQKGIDSLSLLLNMYVNDVKVVAHSTQASEGISLMEDYKPEILFLDINMPGMNGFELLERISWKNFSLVFTTAHQEYALKAIKNNAIDYLLKPIDHEVLQVAVQKIRKQIAEAEGIARFNYNDFLPAVQNPQKQRLLINSRSGIESIDPNEIVCFESQSNYTKIYLSDARVLLTSKTLKEFDVQLCIGNDGFMRVHHSFIVNLSKVSRYLKASDCIVMNNDQQVPVAKSRRENFFNWLDL